MVLLLSDCKRKKREQHVVVRNLERCHEDTADCVQYLTPLEIGIITKKKFDLHYCLEKVTNIFPGAEGNRGTKK